MLHGEAVCRQLAERGMSRILMLTASGAVEDRVDGLTLGADDYLGKPFAFSELIARVGALSRQYPGPAADAPDRRRVPRPGPAYGGTRRPADVPDSQGIRGARATTGRRR
ncbi:MAG: hypothetical protein QOG10_2761 [Kribbellaceae bacterium]|nr:hypothetical protein [Kribbellaceae bacterium]